jgi:drug/metabolite transporter (DMT)-like permease
MTRQIAMTPRTWAELLLLGTIWGGSFLANRVALDEVPVLTAVAVRVALAALVLWGIVISRGTPLPRQPRLWGALLGMGLLNNVLPFTLITWGQLSVPSGLAAIINASTALFGVLLAALVFRDERLTARRLAGVALGLAGVAVAIGPGVLGDLSPASLPQLALVGAALSYATAAVWARRMLRGLAPMAAAAGMLTASSLVMVPLALWVDGVPHMVPGPAALGALGYLAVVATAGAYLLYYRVLAAAGAGNLGLVTLVTVPVAIVAGALVLSESLGPGDYAGFALIAGGLAVIDGRLLRRLASPAPPA